MNCELNTSGPKWLAEKRGTGRTTRMLEAVKHSCVPGSYAFVLSPDVITSKLAQREFERMLPASDGEAKFTHANGKTYWNGAQVSWESCRNHAWSWDTMRFFGAHPSCLYFIDPSCIEGRFHQLLDAWHRFDAESTTNTQNR